MLLPVLPETAALGSGTRELNARSATIILLLYLGAQFGAAFVGSMIATGIGAASSGGVQSLGESAKQVQRIIGPVVVFAFAASAVVMFQASRARIGPFLKDASPTGAAWLRGSWKGIAQGLATGILLSCCYLAFTIAFPFGSDRETPSPILMMAATPGLSRYLLLFLILGMAPTVEELLFRGVLYGGYRKSFGPLAGGILSTGIFWLLHITEMIHAPLAMPSVATLAVVALWFRLNSAAIGPSIAVHFGYNAVLAAALVFFAQ